MYFERDYFVHYYDSDLNRKASILTLLKYFEDAAILHSEHVNRGLDYYSEHHVGWVLYKWDIKLKRFPAFKETIKVRTKACFLKGFQAYRFFDILDSQREQIAAANSMWLFVNSDTRRPAKISEDIFEGYGVDRRKMEMLEFKEIDPLKKIDAKKVFNIRHLDIDTNNHVNNITYVDWALEVIPEDITRKCSMTRLSVNYKKETSYGKQIISVVDIEREAEAAKCIHQISCEDNMLCILETEWAQIPVI
jgi:medium-chain acyl-[acyl-carrier-protein] hydrolase